LRSNAVVSSCCFANFLFVTCCASKPGYISAVQFKYLKGLTEVTLAAWPLLCLFDASTHSKEEELMKCVPVLVAALAATLITAAQASTVDINTLVHGSLDSFGDNNATDGSAPGNILTGQFGTALSYHSYFVFDLSPYAGQVVTSAVFHVTVNSVGYFSSDPTETLGLFDVNSSNIAALQNQHTSGNVSAFNDLAGGNQYGSRAYSASDESHDTTITLNSTGLADLNAALGQKFAIGGALTTIGNPSDFTYLFGASGDSVGSQTNPFLELTVVAAAAPVPAAFPAGLALLGAVGLARAWRRSRIQRALP
jgi:hypothetical protein